MVAVAIPIFSDQLEKSREATDAANLRAAYADVMAEAITNGAGSTVKVQQHQQKKEWQNTSITFPVNVTVPDPIDSTADTNGWTVTSDADGVVTVTALTGNSTWDY